MSGVYEHLRIEKEPLINERRRIKRNPPPIVREDPQAHGNWLRNSLTKAYEKARQQPGAEDGTCVLKLHYSGSLDFKNLQKHGVEFVSQEENSICVIFASEQGLAEFSDHLGRLGATGDDALTYQQILLALDGVGNWSKDDRKSWAIKHFGLPQTEIFRLDVELWPIAMEQSPQRRDLLQRFENWLASRNTRQIDRINRDSLVMYRLELNQTDADSLFEHRDVRLVDLPPRSGIRYSQLDVALEQLPKRIPSPGEHSARICILDSGINSNHPLLRPAVGEAESFVEGHGPDDDAGHGTAVAGIALYGNVEECISSNRWEPEFWLLSGKIMWKDPNDPENAMFDEGTIEQSIEKAVDYFSREHGCRIFNLSLGNENSPYDGRHVRGIAYTLDRLAREYDVLFIVSAGNFRGTETVPNADWRAEYPEYLLAKESCIIDPATGLNIITVGALANHTANVIEQRYGKREINDLSPAGEDQPAPFTRHGPSVKGAIKPELVAHGGNLASPMRREGEQWRRDIRGLGVLTLNHNFTGGTLLKDISGTSFAAPYITHLAGRLLNQYPEASANLLRAMLVNHADIPSPCEAAFPDALRGHIRQVTGYGKVDPDTLFRSTDYEVILLAEDAIENDRHQFYELPLPEPFLRSNRATRVLRISLAYCPPVRTTRIDYAATRISFRLVRGTSLENVQNHFNNATKKEFETIPDASSTNRKVTSTEREKGTIQSSIWTFRQLNPVNRYFVVVTRQDKDWGVSLCNSLENYGVVVTVSDRENAEPRLYTQIQERIREQVRARERIRY